MAAGIVAFGLSVATGVAGLAQEKPAAQPPADDKTTAEPTKNQDPPEKKEKAVDPSDSAPGAGAAPSKPAAKQAEKQEGKKEEAKPNDEGSAKVTPAQAEAAKKDEAKDAKKGEVNKDEAKNDESKKEEPKKGEASKKDDTSKTTDDTSKAGGEKNKTADEKSKPGEEKPQREKSAAEKSLDAVLKKDALNDDDTRVVISTLFRIALESPAEVTRDAIAQVKAKTGDKTVSEIAAAERVTRLRELTSEAKLENEKLEEAGKILGELLRSSDGSLLVQRHVSGGKPGPSFDAAVAGAKEHYAEDAEVRRATLSIDAIALMRALSAKPLSPEDAANVEKTGRRWVFTAEEGVALEVAAKLLADAAKQSPKASQESLADLGKLAELLVLSEATSLDKSQQLRAADLADELYDRSVNSRSMSLRLADALEALATGERFDERRTSVRMSTYAGLLRQRFPKVALSERLVVIKNVDANSKAVVNYRLTGEQAWRQLPAGESIELRLIRRVEFEIYTGAAPKKLSYEKPGTVSLKVEGREGRKFWADRFEEAAEKSDLRPKPGQGDDTRRSRPALFKVGAMSSYLAWMLPVAFLQESKAAFDPPSEALKSEAAIPKEIEAVQRLKREWSSNVEIIYRGKRENASDYLESIVASLTMVSDVLDLAQKESAKSKSDQERVKELLTLSEKFESYAFGFRDLVKAASDLALEPRDEERLNSVERESKANGKIRSSIRDVLVARMPQQMVMTEDVDALRGALQQAYNEQGTLRIQLADSNRKVEYYDSKELYELQRFTTSGLLGRCREYCCYVRVEKPDGQQIIIPFRSLPAPALAPQPAGDLPPSPDYDLPPAPPAASLPSEAVGGIAASTPASPPLALTPLDLALREVETGFRQWKSADGEHSRVAHLLEVVDDHARMLLRDGRRAVVDVAHLSDEDRTILAYWAIAKERKWTDASQSRSVDARLVAFDGRTAELVTSTGLTRKVALEKLSPRDQKLLVQLMAVDKLPEAAAIAGR